MSREPEDSPVDSRLIRTVARNIRFIREMEGLSQEAFADTLGYHRTYWSALERGTNNITLRTIERLADRLGVTALDLLKDGHDKGTAE